MRLGSNVLSELATQTIDLVEKYRQNKEIASHSSSEEDISSYQPETFIQNANQQNTTVNQQNSGDTGSLLDKGTMVCNDGVEEEKNPIFMQYIKEQFKNEDMLQQQKMEQIKKFQQQQQQQQQQATPKSNKLQISKPLNKQIEQPALDKQQSRSKFTQRKQEQVSYKGAKQQEDLYSQQKQQLLQQIPSEYRNMELEQLENMLKKLDQDMEVEIQTIQERYNKKKEPVLKALADFLMVSTRK